MGAWIVYFINGYLVTKYIGYPFYRQFLDILPSILLAVVVGMASYFGGRLLPFGKYAVATLQVLFCMAGYLLGSILLRFDAYKYLCGIVIGKLKRNMVKK